MIADEYPLSPLQQGMLFQHLAGGSQGVDIEQIVVRYHESINVPILERAWCAVVGRHPALRTAFLWKGLAEPSQQVHDVAALRLDRRGTADEDALSRFLREDRLRGFDLAAPPLMRVTVFEQGPSELTLVWTAHHIIVDGRAFVIVLSEVETLYERLVQGKQDALEPGAPYRPYVEWLRSLDLTRSGDFWREKLGGFAGPTPLPADPSAGVSAGPGECELRLSESTTTRLRAVASQHGVTLNSVAMCAWGLLLSRHSGERRVLFGASKTTRAASVAGARSTVGLFLNTVPVWFDAAPEASIAEALQRLRQDWLDLRAHEFVPLTTVRQYVKFPAGQALFDSLFVFENERFDTALAASDPRWRDRECRLVEQTGFPLTLSVCGDPRMLLKLEFDRHRFTPQTMRRVLEQAAHLLEGMAADPSEKLSALSVLTPSERDTVLTEWNQTQSQYPRDVPLARLIEEQAAKTPDSTAVVCGQAAVSYRELDARANQMAHALLGHGAGPEEVVGVCVERSVDMVVALLGVVKAGAAYLPLDPLLPPERLGYILKDSGASLLLTQQSLLDSLPPFGGAVLSLDASEWQEGPRHPPSIAVAPSHLAYVIYTSGSTGKPKGVEVPRGALTNLLWSMRGLLRLGAGDSLLAVTTISFDIAGVDMWLPLLVGARIVVVSREEAADGAQISTLIDRHDITFLQATPVTWRLLLEAKWKGKPNLQIVCTGEAMPRDLAVALQPVVRKLWNLYGPTETTIWSTGYSVIDGTAPVLIGRPVANTQCYILDANQQPVPIGAAGELYIGGDGLARGYRNRDDLTIEKFLRDPFLAEEGRRIYRTGDLARYWPDGNIECLGRTDHQVKIRGFRIELGEIETVLLRDTRIGQAVVTAREDRLGQKRLVAYVVPRGETAPTRQELRASLKVQLPDYMIPADYIALTEIPLSPNGKVDRNALPMPEAIDDAAAPPPGSAAPRNEAERKVATILCEVLGLSAVGVDDDFFDLGGHSLHAVQVIARLNRAFGVDLPLRTLFEARTCAQIAARAGRRELASAADAGRPWPILVPIQTHGSQPPLFCVARPNVNSLGYLFLSRQLGREHPVYGLQAQLPEDPVLDFTHEQYEATAREYIDAMLSVQSKGPYHIIGQCQGAYIAYEMARQLEAAGETVRFLGFLDVWVEENTRRKWLFIGYMYWRALRARARNAVARLRPFAGGAGGSGPIPGTPAKPSSVGSSGVHPLGRTWREYYFPGKDFVPPIIQSRITVFSAGSQPLYRIRDDSLGWGGRTNGGIEVECIPGGHLMHLREPHVRSLAEKVRARVAITPVA